MAKNKKRDRQQGAMDTGAGRQQAQQTGPAAGRQQGGIATDKGRQQSQQRSPERQPDHPGRSRGRN